MTTTKNGCLDSGKTLMHVDTSVPLWAFFDLIGSTTAIQIIGTVSHVMNMAAPPPSSPQVARNFVKNDILMLYIRAVVIKLWICLDHAEKHWSALSPKLGRKCG